MGSRPVTSDGSRRYPSCGGARVPPSLRTGTTHSHCAVCDRVGAAVLCGTKGCGAAMHLPCAGSGNACPAHRLPEGVPAPVSALDRLHPPLAVSSGVFVRAEGAALAHRSPAESADVARPSGWLMAQEPCVRVGAVQVDAYGKGPIVRLSPEWCGPSRVVPRASAARLGSHVWISP